MSTSRTSARRPGRRGLGLPERRLDARGGTVDAIVPAPPSLGGGPHRLQIVDDVVMSGHTLDSVLTALTPPDRPGPAPEVRLMIANARSLARLVDRRPEPAGRVEADLVLDYEPIVQGTVIFLHDLLFGRLLGHRFMEQTALMSPLFGSDPTPLRRFHADMLDLGAATSSAAGR